MSSSDPESEPSLKVNLAPEVPFNLTETPQEQPSNLQCTSYSKYEFNKQFYTLQNYGYATDPSDTSQLTLSNPNLHTQWRSVYQKPTKTQKEYKQTLKQTRAKNEDPGSSQFTGPWAMYSGEESLYEGRFQEISSEQKAQLDLKEQRRVKVLEENKQLPTYPDYESSEITLKEPKATFHGEDFRDYQGRSFVFPPTDLKPDDLHEAYLPKRCVQVLHGHTQAVQAVKFYPVYGHLLLSASLDNTVKIWSATGKRKCIQTYEGHSNVVRDICWNYDGTQFLSCSYDRLIRLWDTETGKVLCTFTCRKIPYCIRFNPNPDKNTAFVTGTANRNIVQYDTNTGKKVQTYEEHLGAVNSVCFVDENRKFISCSDDKKVFLWEFGNPIVAKHISEPSLHAVAYTSLHPSSRHFLGQCLDNNIVVFEARGGFRMNRRKKFTGHDSKGYGCAIALSPDGQYVCSGDANGKMWFWNWKTARNYRTLEAHQDVCLGVDWHPIFSSTIASCGWDGLIKIWD